jgi:pimeloyl-ACP methyl ester carboxylesterase
MDISIERDGVLLKGDLTKPKNVEKCPIVIIFHGLMSNRGNLRRNMFADIADEAVKRGIAAIKFDFNGHGESGGNFTGHSQGALVGGMIAGYYREYIKKLVLLAPAATIKDDAQKGSCFGIAYDTYNVPEQIEMTDIYREKYNLGGLYFRIARTLPIYETTSMFKGETLIIHGSEDEAVGVIGSKRYKECMDNVTLHIIEGESHGLDKFSLNDVVNEVCDFLAK